MAVMRIVSFYLNQNSEISVIQLINTWHRSYMLQLRTPFGYLRMNC